MTALVSTLAAISRRNTCVVAAVRSNYSTYTVDANVSNARRRARRGHRRGFTRADHGDHLHWGIDG